MPRRKTPLRQSLLDSVALPAIRPLGEVSPARALADDTVNASGGDGAATTVRQRSAGRPQRRVVDTRARPPPPSLVDDSAATVPLLVSVKETQRLLSCCHVSVYSLIGAKKLDAKKLGRRTLITMESIHALLADLPPAQIAAPRRST